MKFAAFLLFLATTPAVKPIDGDYLRKLTDAAPKTRAHQALVKTLADVCLSGAAIKAQQGETEY